MDIGLLKRLSMKYYMAWRIHKVHSHFLSVMPSENLYLASKESILSLWDPFSEMAIDEMIELLKPLFNETESHEESFSQQTSSDRNLEYQLPFTNNDMITNTTNLDDFWLDMKQDLADLNYKAHFDIFDPFTHTGLDMNPEFDYFSNFG